MSRELLDENYDEITIINNVGKSNSNFKKTLEDDFFDISSIVIPFSSFITGPPEDIPLDRENLEFKQILLQEFKGLMDF